MTGVDGLKSNGNIMHVCIAIQFFLHEKRSTYGDIFCLMMKRHVFAISKDTYQHVGQLMY